MLNSQTQSVCRESCLIMDFESEKRRVEVVREQIMELIAETETPKDKAHLLALLQIQDALSNNSEITYKMYQRLEQHQNKFDDHERNELAILNKFKGSLWAIALIIGLVQTYGIVAIQNSTMRNEALHNQVQNNVQWISGHTEHHKVEERYLRNLVRDPVTRSRNK